MKKKTKLDYIKEDFEIILGKKVMKELFHLKGKYFYEKFKELSAKLGKVWIDSDYSNFNLYSSNYYLLECCWTYLVSSQAAILNMIKYFEDEMTTIQGESVIDVYSGAGLTTRHLLDKGCIVENVNCESPQVNATKRLLNYHNHKMVYNYFNHSDVKRKYDIVICLETIEHFKDPIPLTKKLIDICESEGYLVETTSFCSPQHYGHFKEYEINNKIVSGRIASRKVHDLIREQFEQVYSGWNGRPRIWRKK